MPRRLAAGLAVAAIVAVGMHAGSAASEQESVTISGRAYAFNHSDTGLAGSVIRVRELPSVSATADANGDYELEVPDDTNVTPYIDPPAGYNEIDLQTFHTRGKPIENVNFQTPADAEYNGLAALLSVPLGSDGRPDQCVIVTTASARNVRGVDFNTFQIRTPHGVADATAHGVPDLPPPIYFNDNVIPDRSLASTSGDGGIIWTGVPAGTYRVITDSPSTRFAGFLATCEPGRIVNANPPWGAYELSPGERPLGAGTVVGRVNRVGRGHKAGHRLVIVHVRTAESLEAKLALRQGRRAAARTQSTTFGAPRDKLPLRVLDAAEEGQARLSVKLRDASGGSVTERFEVRLPPPQEE